MKKSKKTLGVSFDEWNVWYRATGSAKDWKIAPPLLEEYYNHEDALVCAQYLNAFVRNADLVKIACIAQLVNVIAVVMTRKDGLLVQTIYHPLQLFSKLVSGISLTPQVSCPTYKAGDRGETPALDVSACYDEVKGEATFFLVNRDQKSSLTIELDVAGANLTQVTEVKLLHHKDPKAGNTWENPNAVTPVNGQAIAEGGKVRVPLAGLGFAAVRAKLEKQ